MFAAVYFTILSSSYFFKLFHQVPFPNEMLEVFESAALNSLEWMVRNRPYCRSDSEEILWDRLTHSSVHYLAKIHSDASESWNRHHRPGPFSFIRPSELPLLAARDQSMVKKHGTKHIEKVFESQLALVAQSLGLIVVSTRIGERSVDLICISSDASEKSTLLLEAKTTGRPYSLPAKDERALIEYVETVRATLATLPTVRLVAIIGPAASATLEEKLKRLETRAGVPVRFCTAQEIADLREAVPGPVPIGVLVETFLRSPHVLAAGSLHAVAERQRSIQAAHSAFVKALLPQHAAETTPREQWPEPPA